MGLSWNGALKNRKASRTNQRCLRDHKFLMRFEYQILSAVALDLLLGDPRWLPHPVRGIGRLAVWFEAVARALFGSTRTAGVLAALGVYLVTGGIAWGAIQLAAAASPWAGDVVSIIIIYTTVAARDLARHSMAVFRPLVAGNLVEARRCVGAIVGRDTEQLDEAGVARAAVESVAESTVDGVTAPLFFAIVAGPVGAIVYRAINTLDSMFGHQDERYGRFGWAAARIDDLANYVPARLTAPLICLAALLLRLRPRLAWQTLRRDGRKHTSPNAGLTEAAMAGALGVQLGGANYYDGQLLDKPTIGQAVVPLSAQHIRLANRLMYLSAGLLLALCLTLRVGLFQLWFAWRTTG